MILDDISITHLTFGREFTQAVELKQVAQQDAEKARFLVEKAEQIKNAAVISAEGDTEAAELMSKAFIKAGEGEFKFYTLGQVKFTKILKAPLKTSKWSPCFGS